MTLDATPPNSSCSPRSTPRRGSSRLPERHLVRVLESTQKLDPDEIIIVPSSLDEPVILEPSITLKRLPNRTWPASARTLGAEVATSDFLSFPS